MVSASMTFVAIVPPLKRLGQRQCEAVIAIDPLSGRSEAARLEKALHVAWNVLVRTFGPDEFARLQADVDVRAPDTQWLRGPRYHCVSDRKSTRLNSSN